MTIDTSTLDGTTVIIDDTCLLKTQEEISRILERIALIYMENEDTFH